MSQIKVNTIKQATIQMVGNKARGEGFSSAIRLADVEGSSQFLKAIVENSFKLEDWKRFDFIESLSLNPMYQFVSKIFDEKEEFLSQSVNIATYLYDQSLHPNIRSGELYVLLLDCKYEEELVEAIAILKSEKKDPLLATNNDGEGISVRTVYGTGLKGLDKGCLILNRERENGYMVCTVDNINNGGDAHYWLESFLHVVNRSDAYHGTKDYVVLCKDYLLNEVVKKQKKDKLEAIEIMNDVAEFIKTHDVVTLSELKEEVFNTHGLGEDFERYKETTEKKRNVAVIPEILSSREVIDKMKGVALRKIRLDGNVEIVIKNKTDRVMKGYDLGRNMNYYQVFYSEER